MRKRKVRSLLSVPEARAKVCPITRQGSGKGKRCLADGCPLWCSEFYRIEHGRVLVEVGCCTYGVR